MESAAAQRQEQAERLEEQLEEQLNQQREAIEEAALATEMAATEIAEQHRLTTANAWKLQSEAKSERAYSLYQFGMFEDAFRLAEQSIQQDPGNLRGFAIAASSLIALDRSDKARVYLEKQIQLLNFYEYRNSPSFFSQVLDLLSSDKDLFNLGNVFSSTLRKNIEFWNVLQPTASEAVTLANRLVTMQMTGDAKYIVDWLLRKYSSFEMLSTWLFLSRMLAAHNESDVVGKIVKALSEKSNNLISESYLLEIQSLLGRNGKERLDGFIQKIQIDSRDKIEADISYIKQLSEQGELSRKTMIQIMESISEKYAAWKPTIENQLYDATVTSAKSWHVRTYAWVFGILSYIVLNAAAIVYWARDGERLEMAGAFLAGGALLGAILIGSLYGRFVRRWAIYRETKRRLVTAFDAANRRYADLGLPSLTSRSPSGISKAVELSVCVGIVVIYIATWFALMAEHVESLKTSIADKGIRPFAAQQPLKIGVRLYNGPQRRIHTWTFGGGGGVDIKLLQSKIDSKGIELKFSVHAGNRGDLLLYEPPSPKDQSSKAAGVGTTVDKEFERLYVQDESGTKFYSTTGLVGGRQVSFNNYNLIRRINLGPKEEVVLSARFPRIGIGASMITFVSPALNGWQGEWRWSDISLR
jgi:tetratricopeptide (TPR) repeat protein